MTQEIEKIDYDTYNQLYSLMECGRVPTKVELDRFINGLGYRLNPPEQTDKREQIIGAIERVAYNGGLGRNVSGETRRLHEGRIADRIISLFP